MMNVAKSCAEPMATARRMQVSGGNKHSASSSTEAVGLRTS